MAQAISELYPRQAAFLESEADLHVDCSGYPLQIASLYDNGQMVCQFVCNNMEPDAIFGRLEEFAARFEDEGIATDEINGKEHSVH